MTLTTGRTPNPIVVRSGRNRIINGAFQVWQRGLGATAIASAYLADQWNNGRIGTGSLTVSAVAFAPGNVIAGYEPSYYHRAVVVAGSAAGDVSETFHRVEDVRTFAGQTVTLSFWAKADAVKNLGIAFGQDFGAGGGASLPVSGIGAKLIALTAAWQRYSVTVDVPSIAGKTIGTNGASNLLIEFAYDSGATFAARWGGLGRQSGTFDIWGVQLEAGRAASEFEVRSFGDVLARCQRFYYAPFFQIPGPAYTPMNGGGLAGTTVACTVDIVLPVPMRAAPATYLMNGSAATDHLLVDRMGNVQATSIALNVNEQSLLTCSLQIGTGAFLTAGRYYKLFRFNNTIQPGISAEL